MNWALSSIGNTKEKEAGAGPRKRLRRLWRNFTHTKTTSTTQIYTRPGLWECHDTWARAQGRVTDKELIRRRKT